MLPCSPPIGVQSIPWQPWIVKVAPLGWPSSLSAAWGSMGLQNLLGAILSSSPSPLGTPAKDCRSRMYSLQEWTGWIFFPLALFSLPPQILQCFCSCSAWYLVEFIIQNCMFCGWCYGMKKNWSNIISCFPSTLILVWFTDLIGRIPKSSSHQLFTKKGSSPKSG